MNISIEKDRDYSDYEVNARGSPNDKFKISRGDKDSGDNPEVQLTFPTDGKPKLSLETEGVDLLLNDVGRKKDPKSRPEVDRNFDDKYHDHDEVRSVASDSHRERSNPQNIFIKEKDGDNESVTEIAFAATPDSPGQKSYHDSPKFERHDYNRFEQGHFDTPLSRHDDWRDRFDTRSEVSAAPPPPRYTPDELLRHKREILFHLDRLKKRGIYLPVTFTLDSDLDEMKAEYERLKTQSDTDKAIKFYGNMLMAFVSGAEFMNENYNPYKLKLNGWSESIVEKIDDHDYDDVFEELHIKYATKYKLPPELKLLGMVVGTGFMTHLTNTVFKSNLPDFGDVMKERPDLMREFQAAAVNSAANKTPAMGGIFGMMNQMGANIPTGQASGRPGVNPGSPAIPVPAATRSNFQQRTAAPVQRKEMKGPSNVDDILKSFSPVQQRPQDMKPEDIRSVNLSELNDFDRISDISSIDEADLNKARNPLSRPTMGMRPPHRDAFISRMKTRKRGGKKDGGLIIDI